MTLCSSEQKQKLSMDMMEIDGKEFFMMVSDPLQLALQTSVENESKQVLGMGLQGRLMTLWSRGLNLP
jgi:hypothetical protein